MSLDIDAIEARAGAVFDEPCRPRHGIIMACLSCDANVQRSLRTDVPALIARVRELEAQIANPTLPDGVRFGGELSWDEAYDVARDDCQSGVAEGFDIGWNAALRACGYKEQE